MWKTKTVFTPAQRHGNAWPYHYHYHYHYPDGPGPGPRAEYTQQLPRAWKSHMASGCSPDTMRRNRKHSSNTPTRNMMAPPTHRPQLTPLTGPVRRSNTPNPVSMMAGAATIGDGGDAGTCCFAASRHLVTARCNARRRSDRTVEWRSRSHGSWRVAGGASAARGGAVCTTTGSGVCVAACQWRNGVASDACLHRRTSSRRRSHRCARTN